jgi:hypothetical protein
VENNHVKDYFSRTNFFSVVSGMATQLEIWKILSQIELQWNFSLLTGPNHEALIMATS